MIRLDDTYIRPFFDVCGCISYLRDMEQLRTSEPILFFDNQLAKALSDRTRGKILRLLCTPQAGRMVPHTVSSISDRFDLTISTVSHHLQLLRRADLVDVERRGKERYYRLNFDGLRRRVGQFHDLLGAIEGAMVRARQRPAA
jgi:DNA-binding transcriptional ArsR family regulator